MKITTVDRIALGTITTRDNAGRHFAEIWPDSWLTRMETAGYLTITKPVHEQTGLPYSREHWHVEVAAEVADWFDSHGCLVGHEDLYDESGEYPGDIVEQVEAAEAARTPDLALRQDPVTREGASGAYRIIYRADAIGDWFDDGEEPIEDRRYGSAAEALAEASRLYRGPDCDGAECVFAAVDEDVEDGSAAAALALFEAALDRAGALENTLPGELGRAAEIEGDAASVPASVEERGNGFPDAGAYVPGDDGALYKVVTAGSRIETQGAGRGNVCLGYRLVEAAWDDCPEGEEFPAIAIL